MPLSLSPRTRFYSIKVLGFGATLKQGSGSQCSFVPETYNQVVLWKILGLFEHFDNLGPYIYSSASSGQDLKVLSKQSSSEDCPQLIKDMTLGGELRVDPDQPFGPVSRQSGTGRLVCHSHAQTARGWCKAAICTAAGPQTGPNAVRGSPKEAVPPVVTCFLLCGWLFCGWPRVEAGCVDACWRTHPEQLASGCYGTARI